MQKIQKIQKIQENTKNTTAVRCRNKTPIDRRHIKRESRSPEMCSAKAEQNELDRNPVLIGRIPFIAPSVSCAMVHSPLSPEPARGDLLPVSEL